MKMRNLATTALLVGGAVLASQSVFGQQTYSANPNDLLFGFENQAGGATEDYIINLGSPVSIVGKSTVVDLSGDFSLTDFNAVLSGSSSMYGGVIAAANNSNSGTPNTADVYLTQLRAGGAGTPSVPGSSVLAQMSRAQDNTTYASLSGSLASPSAGTGILDTGKSWESEVEPGALNSGNQAAFQSDTGLNPDSLVGTSAVLYEDLWESSSSTLSGTKPYTYLGYFTLDLTGANPKLTFTGVNVPGSLTPPVITSVTRIGSTATVISSSAVPSHSYQLQYTTSLTPPITWLPAGTSVVAAGTTVTNTDSSVTGAQRFYRVGAQ